VNYYGFVSLFNGVVALGLGFYLFFKDRGNALYLSFASFAISTALWAIFYAVWQPQTNEFMALFFTRTCNVAAYFIPFSFLWFCQNLIDENIDAKKPKLPLYFLIPAFFASLNYSRFMIPAVARRLYFPFWPVPGPLMHVCILIYHLAVFYSFYLLIRGWIKSVGIRRSQIKWVTIPMLFAWGGGSTNWFLWYNIPIPPIPNFFVAVFLLIIAYAILRRGVFDPEILMRIVQEAKLSAIGMMAASLNHELRNPLYIIMGRVETHLDAIDRNAYQNPADEITKSREVFSTILQQASRAGDIMQRFSDFAKPLSLGSGRDKDKELVPLEDLGRDVQEFVSSELETKKIRFSSSGLEGRQIYGNRGQLEEIFVNILVNACHAMGDRGGDIELKAYQPNGKVILEISDNGPGIPKKNQQRIFEPFFSTKADKGTGLGLYITKQLVERNGGKIKVKSKVGQGSVFTLEFETKKALAKK